MSVSAGHPEKTELGFDELRRRTRGLSQRHRTMLLLVNGQRSKREVLALASQAGVGVEFFDELVAMGMVDAKLKPAAVAPSVEASAAVSVPPAQWAKPAEPEARIEPGFDDRIERAIAQALSKPEPAEAARPVPMPATTPRAEIVEPPPARSKRAVPTLDDAVSESQLPDTRPAAADPPRAAKPARSTRPAALAKGGPATGEPELTTTARMRFSGAAQKPPKPPSRRHAGGSRREEPKLTPAKPPAHKSARIRMAAPLGPLDDEAEARVLAEVRSLLIGTLLVDGPVTSSLTALRVRKATTRFDLTALVWEIERTLVRAKRPREAQARLAKARDLLGLGNTVVDEETSPDFPRTIPPGTTR